MSSSSSIIDGIETSALSSVLGRDGSMIPFAWDALDEAKYIKEWKGLTEAGRTREELMEECAQLRVQLGKYGIWSAQHPRSWLGQAPSDSLDKLMMVVQLHKAAQDCEKLAEDLRCCAKNNYAAWQDKCGTVYDEAPWKLSPNLRDLLQHVRNVWEHRHSPQYISELGGVHPNDVMKYFEHRFPTIIIDCWESARCSKAGRVVLRSGYPTKFQCRKRPRLTAPDHILIELLRSKEADEERILQALSELSSHEVVSLRETSKRSASPLWFAAQGAGVHLDWPQVVRALLKSRCDADYGEQHFGRTPLFEASWNGHVSTISILLDARANIDARTTGGPSPGRNALMIAALRGMTVATAMLLAAGASREAVDMNGCNALACAREGLARKPHDEAKFTTVINLLTEAAVGQGEARDRKLSHHQRQRERKWKNKVQIPTPEPSE